jgi:futalosine hydrolase
VRCLICTATDFEASLLLARYDGDERLRIIVTGVGPVNAAHATTVAVLERRPEAIVVCGIGGAYPAAGLAIGDVVSAEMEIYGDLGAQSPTGFLDMKALGFPVIATARPFFNELPLHMFPTASRARFVTVSTCTGTDAVAHQIASRTNGAVENMEGAAVVHVAHLFGISVGEVRGISNVVTNRDVKSWKLKEAALAAQEALIPWLESTLQA